MVDQERLIEVLKDFISEHNITTEEDAVSGTIMDASPDLIIAVCELVGYADVEVEDEVDEDDLILGQFED